MRSPQGLRPSGPNTAGKSWQTSREAVQIAAEVVWLQGMSTWCTTGVTKQLESQIFFGGLWGWNGQRRVPAGPIQQGAICRGRTAIRSRVPSSHHAIHIKNVILARIAARSLFDGCNTNRTSMPPVLLQKDHGLASTVPANVRPRHRYPDEWLPQSNSSNWRWCHFGFSMAFIGTQDGTEAQWFSRPTCHRWVSHPAAEASKTSPK